MTRLFPAHEVSPSSLSLTRAGALLGRELRESDVMAGGILNACLAGAVESRALGHVVCYARRP
jgi:hypothetical protein